MTEPTPSAAAQWANLWSLYMHENRALRAEIAGLRAALAGAEQAGRAAERAEIVEAIRNRAELRRQQGQQAWAGMDRAEALYRFNMTGECNGIADAIERRATPNTKEPTQ